MFMCPLPCVWFDKSIVVGKTCVKFVQKKTSRDRSREVFCKVRIAQGQLGKSVKKMMPTAVAISGVTTVIQKIGI